MRSRATIGDGLRTKGIEDKHGVLLSTQRTLDGE
jgi:hypothetical protein